jgi:hypothetical protein
MFFRNDSSGKRQRFRRLRKLAPKQRRNTRHSLLSACRRGVSRGGALPTNKPKRGERETLNLRRRPTRLEETPSSHRRPRQPASPWHKRFISGHAFRQSAFRHWISKSELHHGLFSIVPLKRQTSSQSTPALRTRTSPRSGRCEGCSPDGGLCRNWCLPKANRVSGNESSW